MTTTDNSPQGVFTTKQAGKIINSKVVGFKNGLCRVITEDSNPSSLIEVPGVDERTRARAFHYLSCPFDQCRIFRGKIYGLSGIII